MKVTPITQPLPGEHVGATWPTMRLDLDDSRPRSNPLWRQRMRFWAGRAATAEALERDQENRASRLAWLGRMTTAGIVSGLEVAFEPQTAAFQPLQVLNVASRSDLPAQGNRLAIVARVNDSLHFRVFDSNGQRVRDVSEEDLLKNDDSEQHRRQILDHLRPIIAALGSPANPTEAQRQEILEDFSALVGYRLQHAGHFIHVLPGHGITELGDDVVVPRALRIDLASIPARGLAAHDAPWAAVLIVRPAEFGRFDNVDPTDPCELDPSRDAFADERRQDAALLELIPLPVEWQTRAELGNPDDPRWRNRLAYLVFNDQLQRSARQQLRFRDTLPPGEHWDTFHAEEDRRPWELEGVPLALLASELIPGSSQRRLFLDRGSVARPGGKARPRLRPAIRVGTGADAVALNPPGAGDPALWRARVDQFAEHFGALDPSAPIATQRQFFQFLPPAGLLPKTALEILTTADSIAINADDRATSRFFPATIAVEAVPAPVEDLDAALAASAPLAPFDLAATAPDLVRVIVPVPQRVFDPHLLVIEKEDPIFQLEIGRLVAERQDWRQRRDFVRARQRNLQQLTSGPLPPFTPLLLERGQLEPEPVETSAMLGFTAALLSPERTRQPVELRVVFPPRVVAADTILYARIRTDGDGAIPPIEITWKSGTQEFSHRFETPPAWPFERVDANGQPLATALWRRFSIRAGDLGIVPEITERRTADVTGFELHFDSGHIAIADAGQLVAGQLPGELVEDAWWRAQETGAGISVEQIGGTWSLISGGREFAPFEGEFVPVFDDNQSVAQRAAELDAALNPPEATARKTPVAVATDGMEKVLSELDAEANEADDFVDANFTRAQTNLYRIRKLILGETAAQKLLINPAIATIAEQETANATAEKLSAYITAAKQKPVTAEEANQVLKGTAGRGVEAAGPFRSFAGVELRVAERIRLDVPELTPFQPRVATKTIAAIDKSTVLKDVFGQRAEPGPTLPPRGLSIGQRFVEPKATDNLGFARSALHRLVDQLPNIRLPLVGESAFSMDSADTTPIPLLALQGRAKPAGGKSTEQLRIEARERLLKAATITNATDEAEITLAALDYTETKSAILRTIEKIIIARRAVIQRGRETLAGARTTLALAQNRVIAIEPRLAEARHDVSVARALCQEEIERVSAVNARRDAILQNEVRFLAFVRPRAVDPTRRVSNSWRLESDAVPGDVPACLARHDDPPDELRAYIQLFRHAPARWFKAVAPRLKELNTREKLVELLTATRQSALQFAGMKQLAFARQDAPVATRATLQSAFSIVESVRREASRIQIAPSISLSWAEHQRNVEKYSSLGDIVDGRHGHPEIARAAANELENIESVVACLHAEFAAVAPAIRLAWVERYSQFDRPSPLHDLTVLPRFGSLPRTVRRHFQAFVDWLFGRIDRSQADAVSLVNDLVRICLLLASHAPVKQLIAGHVPRPVPVRPGVRIPIRPLDPNLVRVGMEFHVWQESKVVARGIVEDLQDGEVSARVNHVATVSTTTTIDQTMRVQFVAPAFSIGKSIISLK